MIKATPMNLTDVKYRGVISWRVTTASRVATATLLAGVILAPGCTARTETSAESPKGAVATETDVSSVPRPTAVENKARAMSSIDDNPSMTAEQKAAIKKQLESRPTKP